MVFSSTVFLLLFLPITFVLNLLVTSRFSNGLLLAASLLFYAWGEPVLVLLMAASITINWIIGMIIDRSEGRKKTFALLVGVICDLSILGYYKYAGLFVRLLNDAFHRTILPVPSIALPIGISFFTFQAISYIADVYKGETESSPKLVNTALYISFFPQLIAGPIVKYRDINRQIEKRKISYEGVTAGFKRFIYGLAKKVLISNVLGLCVDTIFAYEMAAIDARTAWIGALAYTFQIYYDFSGYSDMAIGLGKMFGFDILENFNYPYLSRSISEFWRRWHISLGTWFREYVYIPLGGNRKGTARTYLNLSIVFFLTGLWHGADVSFIIWGLYHGLFSVIERLGLHKLLKKAGVLSNLYCFAVVLFGWVFFRADTTAMALEYIGHMVMPWRFAGSYISAWEYMDLKTVFAAVAAVCGMGIMKQLVPAKLALRWKDSAVEACYCILMLVLCLAAIASNTYNPFIYFQF